MKKNIHPEIKETNVTCACGKKFKVKSIKDEIQVEVCSKCHPFFTGKQGRVSKTGKVDKFNKKYGFSEEEE
ncbi:MAG: 50S ribosomal protein L31 [Tenericutes bacterium]|nr:50S ribosomal protein L31 [Mycoplasmatota bacterium]